MWNKIKQFLSNVADWMDDCTIDGFEFIIDAVVGAAGAIANFVGDIDNMFD